MSNTSWRNESGPHPTLWSPYVNPFNYTYIRVIFILLYGAVFLACVIGNILVILVIVRHRKMRNITNYFLVNLAVADMCVGVFCILPNLASYLSTTWYLGRWMCKLYYFVQCVSYTASISILTVISAERYLAIIYPMLCKRMSRMCLVKATAVVVWVITLGYSVPVLIGYDTVDVIQSDNSTTLSFCVKKHQFKMEVYIIMNFVLWYVIPLILMTLMYAKISCVLWKTSFIGQQLQNASAKKQRTTKLETHPLKVFQTTKSSSSEYSESEAVDKSGARTALTNGDDGEEAISALGPNDDSGASGEVINVPPKEKAISFEYIFGKFRKNKPIGKAIGHDFIHDEENRSSKHKLKRAHEVSNPLLARRRIIRLLVAIVVSFAVCVLPHHIRLLWQTFNTKPHFSFSDMLAPPITFLIFYLNSCLNPFLYAILSENFRKALWELTWCMSTCRRHNSSLASLYIGPTLQTNPSPFGQGSRSNRTATNVL